MFKKVMSAFCGKVKKAKTKMALFLALGMIAVTQSSYADLVNIADDGAATFDPGHVVNQLKGPAVSAINSGSTIWIIIIAAGLVIGLIARFIRGRK